MRTLDALKVLSSLVPPDPGLLSEVGTRRDIAFVRISSPDTHRWAVVSSPGDRWFALEVNGGFSLDKFEEDTLDEDVRAYLTSYVGYALQYVRGSNSTEKRNLLGLPEVELTTAEGTVRLSRSLYRTLRDLTRLKPPKQ